MHILVLSSWYPNEKAPLLGVFVKRHALAAARFHDVTVLHCLPDYDMKEGEFRIVKNQEDRFREVLVYFGRKAGKPGLKRMMQQNRLLKKHYAFGISKVIEWFGKPDVLHLSVVWPLGRIAAKIANSLNIPMVVTEHWTGYQPEDGRYKGMLMKWLTRKTLRKARVILPVSAQLGNAMRLHGINGNYQPVPNVANEELFQIYPLEKKNRLIHVSVPDDAQKNISGLLQAFARVRRKIPDLELLIVGSGADERKLKRLSNELGLTTRGVEFAGKLEGVALAKALCESLALVMNSRYENQPVVIIEALLCGIPVIAPAIGGIPEMLHEKNGVMFDSGTIEQALLNWHARKTQFDAETIRREAINIYSMNAVGEMLSRIYLKVSGKC